MWKKNSENTRAEKRPAGCLCLKMNLILGVHNDTIPAKKVPKSPLGPGYNSGIPKDDLNIISLQWHITRPQKNHRSFASCRNSWDASLPYDLPSSCNQSKLVPGTRFFSSPFLMPDVSPPNKKWRGIPGQQVEKLRLRPCGVGICWWHRCFVCFLVSRELWS